MMQSAGGTNEMSTAVCTHCKLAAATACASCASAQTSEPLVTLLLGCRSHFHFAAVAAATACPTGVYRASGAGGSAPLSFSTVEADPISSNPDRRTEVVKPRARSAQDLGGLTPRPINLSSGAPQVPVLVTNGAAVSQT
jgi:hypothetical protein